ncbi:MAG TPA: hypothetical protein VM488_09870, partial [Pseudobacter sp.]|nr:hypothetical protein [Pseudobacter sp.]
MKAVYLRKRYRCVAGNDSTISTWEWIRPGRSVKIMQYDQAQQAAAPTIWASSPSTAMRTGM